MLSYLAGMKYGVFLFLFVVLNTSILLAQTSCPDFWGDIQKFKSRDSAQMPPKGAILFVGSSSFTKWQDVQAYFPDYAIINRGFGGSNLVDVIRYAYDVILPYKPKQVVVYCGENDFAGDPALTAADVVSRFKTLFGIIRQNLPNAVVDYISMKPSPSRAKLFPKFRAANQEIKTFLKGQKNAGFINVYDAMLDKTGEPQKDIFIEDNLHMNANGYQIWKGIIQPYLKK